MSEQFQKGENVLVYYQEQEDDLQPGIIVGTNANTGNEQLLYTVKLDDKYWVGRETNLFPPSVSSEEAKAQVEEKMQELEEKAIEERESFEEEQRRLEEIGMEEAEELEEAEMEAAPETTRETEEEI